MFTEARWLYKNNSVNILETKQLRALCERLCSQFKVLLKYFIVYL